MRKNNVNEPVDFVLLWVDGSDPLWLAEKNKYSTETGDDRPQRFRDWDILRYWFRGVEKFASWVRTVHFVTWGHLPVWLKTDHPKLHIVNHKDYMPEEALPVFSSRALEINMHRIEGLSEHFVYFNDDFLLINHTKPEDFFIGGLPRDMLALQPVVANPVNPQMSSVFFNNSMVISRHFDKRSCMKKNPGKFFKPGYPPKYFIYNILETVFPLYTGFYTVHGPSPFIKSTFDEVWKKEPDVLKKATFERFRGSEDVNQYLFREWQKQKGEFYPANLHRDFYYLDGSDISEKKLRVITGQKRKMICINDSDHPYDFEKNRNAFANALDSILPEPCGFEKTDSRDQEAGRCYSR